MAWLCPGTARLSRTLLQVINANMKTTYTPRFASLAALTAVSVLYATTIAASPSKGVAVLRWHAQAQRFRRTENRTPA